MPNFTAGTSFTDGVTNDVTAAKLNALIADAVPTSSLSLNSTTGTISQFSSGTGTAASPAIQPTGDTNTGIFFPAADTIAFSEGGTESMRIDSSGNVGVGTTVPSVKLDITGPSNGSHIRIGNGRLYTFKTSADGIYDNAILTLDSNSSVSAYAISTNGSERLRIDSSGNLNIGSYHSGGNGGRWTSDGELKYRLSTSEGIYGFGSAGMSLQTTSNHPIIFQTNSTERLRITSGGEVCVGRTSSGAKLHIYNSGSTDARTAYFEKATGATDGYYIVCYAGGTSHFLILGNGNCQNANNSYSGISDIKLKQDITDASSQWSDIKNLRVRKYRFKEYPEMPLQIGLVAQEVELVSPQLVEETKDTDREGNDLGTITKGVKYSVLYMKAVKALQEAMDRIEQLESKVAALEAA